MAGCHPNQNVITAGHDADGRLTEVWLPTETEGTDPATVIYESTIVPNGVALRHRRAMMRR
jgi:hypothetical protein